MLRYSIIPISLAAIALKHLLSRRIFLSTFVNFLPITWTFSGCKETKKNIWIQLASNQVVALGVLQNYMLFSTGGGEVQRNLCNKNWNGGR